ncbi:hypothetical protein G6F62_015505 [Rhizopus arrhizus]|nr:hypothetical protein G6F62_015505 [Rhizopus arrhizus]
MFRSILPPPRVLCFAQRARFLESPQIPSRMQRLWALPGSTQYISAPRRGKQGKRAVPPTWRRRTTTGRQGNMSDTVDVIVVGAGSAGCVMANRLSADGALSV